MEYRATERQDLNENFGMLANALSAIPVIKLSPATAAPTVAECTAAAQVYKIGIRLENAAGDLHSWYNGKVLLAIADDDSTGVASIVPAAGEISLVNGVGEVEVTMSKAAWTAGKKATLTVSKPTTAKAPVMEAVADATFVATVAS